MGKKLSKEEFIERSNIIHKNKYNYILVEYIDAKTKIKIICPIHGVFEQEPHNHLQGCECKKCAYINNSNNNHSILKDG